ADGAEADAADFAGIGAADFAAADPPADGAGADEAASPVPGWFTGAAVAGWPPAGAPAAGAAADDVGVADGGAACLLPPPPEPPPQAVKTTTDATKQASQALPLFSPITFLLQMRRSPGPPPAPGGPGVGSCRWASWAARGRTRSPSEPCRRRCGPA